MTHHEKRITWSASKNRLNAKKHRVGFEEAATVFYDPLSLTVDDPEHSVDEPRLHIIGQSSGKRLMVITFAESNRGIRIVSARMPTRSERKHYEEG